MTGAPISYSGRTLAQVNGADPAAAAEVEVVVPAGEHWGLCSISVALVQGATQTPQPILILDDGADVFFECFGSSAAQAAATTCRYTWAPDLELTGLIGSGANVHTTSPIPGGIVLGPGFRIRTSTIGIGANSNYGVPSLLVVKWT